MAAQVFILSETTAAAADGNPSAPLLRDFAQIPKTNPDRFWVLEAYIVSIFLLPALRRGSEPPPLLSADMIEQWNNFILAVRAPPPRCSDRGAPPTTTTTNTRPEAKPGLIEHHVQTFGCIIVAVC